MKIEPIKLTRKDHKCNAIRFLTKRYLETTDWTGYLKDYRIGCGFDSKEHTVLENLWLGIGWQLHAMLIQMAGYDYVSYIDAHQLSEAPEVVIEEALAKFRFKKNGTAEEVSD